MSPFAEGNKVNHPVSVHSATLNLYLMDTYTNDAPVNVHRVTEDWDEATVTWNSFAGAFDPAVENSFMVDVAGWRSVDVTDLVADWIDGAPNFGMLLDQPEDGSPWAKYHSRENANSRPYLEICLLMADGEIICEEVEAGADTYIWEYVPDTNFGGSTFLYTGWKVSTEHMKQTLLKFEVPEIPDEPSDGCTLTPGYWKTHSEFGPAPYDPTWALLPDGASTVFFLSGKTFYEVLWTPPAGGNAYYILSHAYIAAQLNQLNGADFTDAQEAFDAATDYFNTYTPAELAALPRQVRRAIISLAETLDDYNNGLIGPGHCD